MLTRRAMRTLSLAPLAVLLAAPLALAAPDLGGTFDVIGRDATGSFRGSAAVTQSAQGAVRARLSLAYTRWSFSAGAHVPTGRRANGWLFARVDGQTLRGVRRLDGGPYVAIRYAIRTRADGSVSSVRGTFQGGWDQLHGHRPAAPAGRDQALAALRAELEQAVDGLWWMSESDHRLTWVQQDGAAASVASVDDWKRLLGLPADRPAEQVSLDAAFGGRIRHHLGESPEEAARVDRHIALEALLEARLTDIRVYRVGDEHASVSGGFIVGAIRVFFVGRTAWGDLVGLETISVET